MVLLNEHKTSVTEGRIYHQQEQVPAVDSSSLIRHTVAQVH